MKMMFFFMFLLSFFLTGCNNQITPEKNSDSLEETPIKAIKEKDGVMQISGGYIYYLETDSAPYAYRKNILNRICFEPAQLEIVNNGSPFCFSNTQEALEMLKIEKIDNECKKYWGVADIKIKNLSKKNRVYKADPCVQDGSCEFNEAELLGVIESYEEMPQPQCEK